SELKQDMTEMKSDVSELKQDVDVLKQDMTEVKDDVDHFKKNMAQMEHEIKDIKTYQENVISRNIKLVAEGHLDLVRNLNTVMRESPVWEMISVRMNMVEGDIKRIRKVINKEEILV
ncbi:MAG: hypothetical protein Q4C59_06655, partial [Lachnospiraceae bacterium]|nr:hypothetical protein [Lachnospiraceae bacterium]